MFITSLTTLTNFALNEPRLSLNNRRSIVAAIYLAGNAGCSSRHKLILELAEKSHQYTKDGLEKAFYEKLSSKNPELPDAIMKISSISAWIMANPFHFENTLEAFSLNMVPEDTPTTTLSHIQTVVSNLRSNWGIKKTLNLVAVSQKCGEKNIFSDK